MHPATFRHLIALSDGATFTIRTTSPRCSTTLVRDTLNSPLWNPLLSTKRYLLLTQVQLTYIGDNCLYRDTGGSVQSFNAKYGDMSLFDTDTADISPKKTVKKAEKKSFK
jgi:hypothetical protein